MVDDAYRKPSNAIISAMPSGRASLAQSHHRANSVLTRAANASWPANRWSSSPP